MNRSEHHYHNIRETILSLIYRGNNTFDKLIENLYGIYPNDLEELLSKLVAEGIIKIKDNKYILLSEFPLKIEKLENVDDEYKKLIKDAPVPHPLEFDWKFSLNALKYIFNKIFDNHILYEKNLLFLGSPSVGIYFACVNTFLDLNIKIGIIDKNERIIKFINEKLNSCCTAVCYDLQYELPTNLVAEKNDIVVMDPPWYSDYYKIFLSRTIRMINEKGWLYSSLFPIYTRPSAVYERIEVIKLFIESGFSTIAIIPSVLEYEIPPFEKKALDVSGIDVKQNWRFGDLIILQSTGYLRPLIFGDYILDDFIWKEISFSVKRIKIRTNPMIKTYIKPKIIPLFEKSSVFPTVSRRHPNRKFIDMWTSDNEVYALVGHNVVYDILKFIESGYELEIIVEKIANKYGRNKESTKLDIIEVYEMLKNLIRGC